MNEILNKGKLPESWQDAYITLIPKQGTDLMLVQYYRLISLSNNDYKLFADILANRLKRILKDTIHEDQAGFLLGCQMKNNIRIEIDMLEHLEERTDKQAALMFVDAEKAFDKSSWNFMKKTMGLGKF